MIEDFDGDRVEVRVLDQTQFDAFHQQQLLIMTYDSGLLRFTDPRWRCRFLGAGEEKAAYLICDHERRVFVAELIDERTYLNGRFVTGAYFGSFRVSGVAGVARDPDALMGLRFTGLVKVRQYAPGYEWGRFQWRPDRRSILDIPLTILLQTLYAARFEHYQRHYRDVHERNVVFELRSPRRRGIPMVVRDSRGKCVVVRVGLQPIDLR